MANAVSYSTTVKNARCDAITSTTGNNAYVRVYAGTAPANAGTALSGNTLLAEFQYGSSTPIAGAASSGALSCNIPSPSAGNPAVIVDGTPTFFRVYKSDGTTCTVQGTAGASSCDMNISGLQTGQLKQGGTCSISSFSITDPN